MWWLEWCIVNGEPLYPPRLWRRVRQPLQEMSGEDWIVREWRYKVAVACGCDYDLAELISDTPHVSLEDLRRLTDADCPADLAWRILR